jgi:hypothetical protein
MGKDYGEALEEMQDSLQSKPFEKKEKKYQLFFFLFIIELSFKTIEVMTIGE